MAKINELEGLRGLAAFMVLLYHLDENFNFPVFAIFQKIPSEWIANYSYHATSALTNGVFAVWVFWILSAFVLSLRFFYLQKEGKILDARSHIRMAALKRYFRLMPLVFTSVMLAFILWKTVGVHHLKVSTYISMKPYWIEDFYNFQPDFFHALYTAFISSFILFETNTSYNPVLWTIEIEFFGSFILFSFLYFCCTHKTKWLFYGLSLLACIALNTYWPAAFIIGILMADFYVNVDAYIKPNALRKLIAFRQSKLCLLLLLLSLLPIISKADHWAKLHPILAISIILMVLYFKILQRFLQNSILQFLGKISFALYVCHVPIIFTISNKLYLLTSPTIGDLTARIFAAITTVIICIFTAWVLYVSIDKRSPQFSYFCASKIKLIYSALHNSKRSKNRV